jgi:hypothetical protein
MLKSYTFWLKAAIVLLFLGAAFHSISFFVDPDIQNETERQLHTLMTTYRKELPIGFHRTFFELFTALSACFTFLCVLAGLMLTYLLRKRVPADVMKGILLINVLLFGACLVVMIVFAFIFPIATIALILATLLVAYLLCPRHASS